MGFLDNLENSLKNLESQDERDGSAGQRREADRARTLAAAPWAEKLRNSEYTRTLFDKAAAAGHRLRTKIYMTWFDSALRLNARDRHLELKPTPDGVVAEMSEAGHEPRSRTVDLAEDPQVLLDEWLG